MRASASYEHSSVYLFALFKCNLISLFFCRLHFFSKLTSSKNCFRNINGVSNSLDPDQAQHFVGPDLGPNCLQKLSADDTGKLRVNL